MAPAFVLSMLVVVASAALAWRLAEHGGWLAYLLAVPLLLASMGACWLSIDPAMRGDLWRMLESRLRPLRNRVVATWPGRLMSRPPVAEVAGA